METRELKSLSRIQPTGDRVLVRAQLKVSAIKLAEGSHPTIEKLIVIGYGEAVPNHIKIGQEVVVFDIDQNSWIGKTKMTEIGEYETNLHGEPKFIYAMLGSYEIRGILKDKVSDDEIKMKKEIDEMVKPKVEILN